MKPVIVIIDMQKDFFKNKNLANIETSMIKKINELTSFARERGIPVMWIRQIWNSDLSNAPKHIKESKKGYVLAGSGGCELLGGLEQKREDIEVIKTRYSGFFNTNLEKVLKNLKVDTLIVGGINTHACVRMTIIDAWQRDYNVIIAKDCVGSYDNEHHRITMKYFEPVIAKIMTNEGIKTIVRSSSISS